MRLKSYFSWTVEAAMELARRELGEEALLVNARPATPETRHLGAYEVVFGATGAPPAPPVPVSPTLTSNGSATRTGAAPKDFAPPADRITRDVADMRREIERLARSLRGAHMFLPGPLAPATESPCSEAYTRLLDNELDGMIAQSVAQGAPLEQFFEVDSTLGRHGSTRAVIALVGPPGAGKTTTLIKLAARYGAGSRSLPQIITTDVFRIAAVDQLRALASILGIGCEVAETPLALAQALEEHGAKELVFIDTPGLANGEMEDGGDLARIIATHPEIDTHLVLPASMKLADMRRVIERYAIFHPDKLLFTRLDETERYGALISEPSRCGLPVSFLASGQQIPDDLEPATKARMIEMVAAPRAASDEASRHSMGAAA
jgi:flagellar biosynthesis protein FlhF